MQYIVSNTYITSDHHFFLKGISKYRRFSSVDEMNISMIEKWNSIIKNDDWVFYLGDLSSVEENFSDGLLEIIKALNGNKILVRGNHDLQPDDWYTSAGFKAVYPFLNLEGILMGHYPTYERNFRPTYFYECGQFDYVIHGHVHNLNDKRHKFGQRLELESKRHVPHYNVAVDHHDYSPLLLENVVPEFSKEKFMTAITKLILSL